MKPSLFSTLLLAAGFAMATVAAHAHGEKRHAPAKAVEAAQTDWGIAGKRRQVSRTVAIDMTDAMRFVPDRLSFREGETVRFVIRNRGRMLHEMVIGTSAELRQHAAMMAKFPGMEHEEAYMAHVDPGQTGTILWKFNRAGEFEFACLLPGHYEAGMRGTISVAPSRRATK